MNDNNKEYNLLSFGALRCTKEASGRLKRTDPYLFLWTVEFDILTCDLLAYVITLTKKEQNERKIGPIVGY